MPRNAAVTVPISALPAFLRDTTAAELVAVALEAQGDVTYETAEAHAGEPVIYAGIRAQAAAYKSAAKDVRDSADVIAAVHADPNGVSP